MDGLNGKAIKEVALDPRGLFNYNRMAGIAFRITVENENLS